VQERERLTIGVLAGWQVYEGATSHSYLAPILQGVRAAAQERGCNLLLACGMAHPVTTERESVHPAWPLPSPEADFVPVGPWNTDGLLVVTPLLCEERSRYLRNLSASGHPLAFVGSGEPGLAVVPAIEEGIREALAHLVSHGHRRIALIHRLDESAQKWRDAYASTVEALGLEVEPGLVTGDHNNYEGGRRAMRRILDSGSPFTAVLANNDEAAVGVMEVLREAGRRIPEDVALVGFDDRLEAAALDPPLTTIRFKGVDAGHRALDLLVRCIRGRAGVDEVIRVPCRLVIRESCGCLPDRVLRVDRDGRNGSLAPGRSTAHTGGDAKSCLPREMAEAVAEETVYLDPDEIRALCERLAGAFAARLAGNGDEGLSFRLALRDALRRVEAAGDDPHPWHAALSALAQATGSLAGESVAASVHLCAEDILRRAGVAISAAVRRQYRRHVVAQRRVAEQIGVLTARLLDVLDEAHVFDTLREYLPGTDVRRADVAYFQPEGDDPVAWSVLQGGSGSSAEPGRFPSRCFPPRELYPPGEPYCLALLPLKVRGDLLGFVAFDAANLEPCAAITRQLATAIRGARLYQQAVEGQRLAEEASRAKSRFLATVSHELRTPLNLVMGLSEILLSQPAGEESSLPPRTREDVVQIHTSAQHLDSLIRDVLDLARSDVGSLQFSCEPLDLAEVLQPVLATGEQMARAKGLRWRADVPGDLPPVLGDRTRLRQVALNLVSNATKFTRKGEVALECGMGNADRLSPIAYRRSQIPNLGSQMVVVSVSDTGLGIPPTEQEIIFDEFRQSERTTEREYGGIGLGLAICRRLIEMHGGRIWAESSGEEGEGARFTFALPVVDRSESEGADTQPAGERAVLLLAEEPECGRRLGDQLAGQGFAVEVAFPGEVGDWPARLALYPPGAVILGPNLEGGWEVLRELKGNPATKHVPVLFCSLEDDRGAVLEMDTLIKPVGTAELIEALRRQGLMHEGEDEPAARSLLLVDDEPAVLEMHARVVQAWLPDCRVFKARDGLQAMDVIRRERPDLVLLDLMMPEMDGFGVLEAMQEEEAIRDIPVILLTGQVLSEEDVERLSRGVTAVLGKGMFTVEETLAHVERALARRVGLAPDVQQIVRRAMAYLHEHHAEDVSRDEVARHVGLSGDHLTRCFRQELGMTLVAYLNRYRVRKAKQLLEEGMSVTETALAVGFASPSHFSRLFKREVGVPPSAYRERPGKG
jgi:signal transduction histidine kinase/DNA-binding LacI/PurR family transcriptional regulator/AraC-like DNA-binding protein